MNVIAVSRRTRGRITLHEQLRRRAGYNVTACARETTYSQGYVSKVRKRGEIHGLSPAEVKVADDAGMTLPRYVGMRGVRSLDDFARVRDSEAERLRERAREAIG